jgi:hypothetical protein
MKRLWRLVLAASLAVLGTSCSEGGKGVNKDRDRPTPPEQVKPAEK